MSLTDIKKGAKISRLTQRRIAPSARFPAEGAEQRRKLLCLCALRGGLTVAALRMLTRLLGLLALRALWVGGPWALCRGMRLVPALVAVLRRVGVLAVVLRRVGVLAV